MLPRRRFRVYSDLKKAGEVPSGEHIALDGALVLLVLATTLQDLIWFVLRVFATEWQLRTLGSSAKGFACRDLVGVTRVTGWGNMEAGLFGLVTLGLRARAYQRRARFAATGYLLFFGITTVGKIGALATTAIASGVPPTAETTSIDESVAFARVVVNILGSALSTVLVAKKY